MVTIIRDDKLTRIAEGVKPDPQRRVHLPKGLRIEGICYHIYANSIGQIILDPQVTIPVSEAWLFKDGNLIATVDKSMNESLNGQLIDRGSFSKYAKDDP